MQTVKQTLKETPRSVENDPELKAFIYQHLVELQPFLAPESQISVLVGQNLGVDGGVSEHALTLVATLGEYRLEAEGQNEDVYEAFILAKRRMLVQLEDWFAASVDTNERDKEIQAVIEGRHLVH